MASSRIISRILVPTTLGRLSTMGNMSGQVRHFFNRNPNNLPDLFFGSTRNVFRDLDREFERMQKQFDNYFRDFTGTNNRPLANFLRTGANGKYFYFLLFKNLIILSLLLFRKQYDCY